MALFLVLGLAAVVYLFYFYTTRTFNYWCSRNVQGPKPVPLFGNLKDSTLRRENITIVVKKIYDAYPDEKVVGVYRMTTPDLLIRDPDIVKQVMIKDFEVFPHRGVLFDKDGLGANLFHAEAVTWKILRRKFTPIFTSGKVKQMLHLLIDRSDNFITYVENVTLTHPEQEVFHLTKMFTITAISACAFGLDIDILKQDKVMDMLLKIDKSIFTINYANELDMMYPGIISKFGGSLFPADVKKFFHNLVKDAFTTRNGKPSNRRDFMDCVLELKQAEQVQGTQKAEKDEVKSLKITESIIAAQAFVFFAAGYETSASTMGFMLMQLALNPDIQEKVVTEIKEVLKQHEDKITYEALREMTYLKQVFDETLRMYPSVDPLLRRAVADYQIPGTEVVLKKGQTVLISACGLHYDEKYWSNPTKFDPDRFSPEKSASRHPAVYLPFGIGPRNCIGMQLAMVQSRVCAVRLLQRFRLEPTEHTSRELKYDPHRFVFTLKEGCKMNLLPRQ